MDRTISRPAGKEQLLGPSLAVKLARRAHSVGESIGRAAARVGPRAEDDCHVGWPSIIGFAEAEHLQQRKQRAARERRNEHDPKASLARIRLRLAERRPAFRAKRQREQERKRYGPAGMKPPLSQEGVKANAIRQRDHSQSTRAGRREASPPAGTGRAN